MKKTLLALLLIPAIAFGGFTNSGGSGGGGGSGSVTSVSVTTANGMGGTVANPTTTPAITITTGVTGLMFGNGTAASAYGGTSCTNQFPRSLNASGVATCASIANIDLAGSIAASKLIGTDIATVGTITAGTWNATLIGTLYGGTGVTDLTFSGSTHKVATTTGALTSGNCVKIDASGNFIDNGSGCAAGTPGGSSGQIQYNNAGAFGGLATTGTGNAVLAVSPTLTSPNIGAATGTSFTASGSTSGTLQIKPAAVAGTGSVLTLPGGTTDFSATGGTSQVVKQATFGAALTVGQLAASDMSNGTTGTGAVVLAASPTLSGTITAAAANFSGNLTAANLAALSGSLTNGGAIYTDGTSVLSGAALTNHAIVLGTGASGSGPKPLASLGTSTTVLHGAAAGDPTFGAVSLTADVSGTLPAANGGTGVTDLTFSGSTHKAVTTTGTLTSGDCVKIDASGNFIANGSACGGGGGSGTVTSVAQSFTGGLISVGGSPVTTSGTLALTVAGTSGGIPYFDTSSSWTSSGALTSNSLVLGGGAGAAPKVAAGIVTDGTSKITLGTSGTNVGSVSFNNATSGTINLAPATGALGTSNLVLPIASATLTYTVASGTSALGTSAISSGACATVVTTSATGTATTDNIMADFNADPTAVTGYVASTAGMLTIIKYPTANNVNFKVCNNTASSITPGAITLNWRVVR